ncbi:hypothetical protein [Mesorhizobium australicum]|uniref:DUF3828 domain-containing protein n=1 Tax=Mesorhizobium australicum TaxID=536018 RepID=A0A1X7NW86_9HYPH|nr:hypothetical protein [Mesorhizobium australicum]SMH41956.1 hypothetical protein SAMN02982922_2662 [Mesorhizobium australicum]
MLKTRLSVAAVLFAVACPAWAEPDVGDVSNRFCELQTADDMAGLRELMTADLRAIVEDAEERNAAVADASGHDSAPLAAGIPYRGVVDRPASCLASKVSPAANVTIVDIAYYSEKGERWTDRLVLKPETGEMRVDDILFASFPTDTYQAGLRRVLADTFDQ